MKAENKFPMERRRQEDLYDDMYEGQSRDKRGVGYDARRSGEDEREHKRRRFDDPYGNERGGGEIGYDREDRSRHHQSYGNRDRPQDQRPSHDPPHRYEDSLAPGSGHRRGSRFDLTPQEPQNSKQEALEKVKSIASKFKTGTENPNPGRPVRNEPDRGADGRIRKKIVFPLDKFPNVNFIGGLVGPGGATLKSIEAESGSRIFIRGRGTQKDGQHSAEDDEPTHALVIGDDEGQIMVASKLINDVIDHKIAEGPPPSKFAKGGSPYGPPQTGSGSSDFPRGGPPGGMGNVPQEEQERIIVSVPNNRVGSIIGRGGEVIKRIMENSKAHVQVEKDMDTNHSSPERNVFIEGSKEAVQIAREMIGNIIMGRGLGPGTLPDGVTEKKIKVPVSSVGLVIGRGGETIREFQDRSRARIIVDREDGPDGMREVTLIGTDENLAMAEELIRNKINSQGQSRGSRYSGGPGGHGSRSYPSQGDSHQYGGYEQQRQPQHQQYQQSQNPRQRQEYQRGPDAGLGARDGPRAGGSNPPGPEVNSGDVITNYDQEYYQRYLQQYYAYIQAMMQSGQLQYPQAQQQQQQQQQQPNLPIPQQQQQQQQTPVEIPSATKVDSAVAQDSKEPKPQAADPTVKEGGTNK